MSSLLAEARLRFHSALQASFLTVNASGVPSNADKDSTLSVALARGIFSRLGLGAISPRVAGQTLGINLSCSVRVF